MNWQPTASQQNLHLRAAVLHKIREFFRERHVLEVETPLLCATTATDPYIDSFYLEKTNKYLQTSPEFAMKRLLAAGSGAIYQICKAFRNDEVGRYHNPEFSMLEWYRPGFNHRDLMVEMDEFLQFILATKPAEKCSYKEVFLKYLGVNPHRASLAELKEVASLYHLDFSIMTGLERDDWLHLLFTHCIEPKIGFMQPLFIYDYPASQAALAQIRNEDPPVAERFEVYFQGIELANGYHELGDASEQRQRFIHDIAKRQAQNRSIVPIDENLLAALDHHFPACAGVALGIDRLVMLASNAKSIHEVLTFYWENS